MQHSTNYLHYPDIRLREVFLRRLNGSYNGTKHKIWEVPARAIMLRKYLPFCCAAVSIISSSH